MLNGPHSQMLVILTHIQADSQSLPLIHRKTNKDKATNKQVRQLRRSHALQKRIHLKKALRPAVRLQVSF